MDCKNSISEENNIILADVILQKSVINFIILLRRRS